MWPNPQFPADLATFTEEILNSKLHFLCSHLQKLEEKKCPKMVQNIQQLAVLTLLHPGNPGKLSQVIFCFKICYVPKIYALETVDKGLKNSSFHALLTIAIKELYTVILSNMQFNLSSCRVFS